jgi:hypothetical protein
VARRPADPARQTGERRRAPANPTGALVLVGAAFLGAALLVYRPALDGPFLSDDHHYVRDNAHIRELSPVAVARLFDPSGDATIEIVNYAPLQLLVHGLAWRAFGANTIGHHLINVVLHALASLLLVALFASVGIPLAGALAGGALFLLHPANVEAVAWISQLKSTLALPLALAALLAWNRRPGLATAAFAAALLAKPTAAFALPVAALFDHARRERVRWGWLGVWALALAAYSAAEFTTHQRTGAAEATLHDTPFVLIRTMAAIGARYLVMAATSAGVSAFHEPPPATSLLDPWWLLALAAAALLLARLYHVLRRRKIEAAFWVWAAASFAPVSQVFPFLYPMADRYLYFILPGLLGGALLAGGELLARLPGPRRTAAARAALACAAVLAAVFAVRSTERAGVWRSNALLLADAAAHYPDGKVGSVLAARRAVATGDFDTALDALEHAERLGYNRFEQLELDRAWEPIRREPRFRALVERMADGWIASARRKRDLTRTELRMLAHAHVARGDPQAAVRVLEQALEAGGPGAETIRAELAALRAALASGTPERVRLGVSGDQ